MLTYLLVAVYLAAIVAANMISAHFGATASIYNAFGLIGLSLTTRDRLHDAWGAHRFRNMALLIATGSALSYVATVWIGAGDAPAHVAARIALASCVAFFVSESLDAGFYHLLRDREWLERSNLSNVLGAAVDSMVFVSIAFGWTWPIIFGQFCAKVAGGFLWSLVLKRARARRAPIGIAMNDAKAGEPVRVAFSGTATAHEG